MFIISSCRMAVDPESRMKGTDWWKLMTVLPECYICYGQFEVGMELYTCNTCKYVVCNQCRAKMTRADRCGSCRSDGVSRCRALEDMSAGMIRWALDYCRSELDKLREWESAFAQVDRAPVKRRLFTDPVSEAEDNQPLLQRVRVEAPGSPDVPPIVLVPETPDPRRNGSFFSGHAVVDQVRYTWRYDREMSETYLHAARVRPYKLQWQMSGTQVRIHVEAGEFTTGVHLRRMMNLTLAQLNKIVSILMGDHTYTTKTECFDEINRYFQDKIFQLRIDGPLLV